MLAVPRSIPISVYCILLLQSDELSIIIRIFTQNNPATIINQNIRIGKGFHKILMKAPSGGCQMAVPARTDAQTSDGQDEIRIKVTDASRPERYANFVGDCGSAQARSNRLSFISGTIRRLSDGRASTEQSAFTHLRHHQARSSIFFT